MVAATRELPASGYATQVDGQLEAKLQPKTAQGQVRRAKKTLSHASGQDL